jgi:hypothetical protein
MTRTSLERVMTVLKQCDGEFHYHIRWLPGDLLDWQPFSTAKTAAQQARKLVSEAEIYTIERFSAACRRCQSRRYSEPTKAPARRSFRELKLVGSGWPNFRRVCPYLTLAIAGLGTSSWCYDDPLSPRFREL